MAVVPMPSPATPAPSVSKNSRLVDSIVMRPPSSGVVADPRYLGAIVKEPFRRMSRDERPTIAV
jgi:hypothetical protein